MAASNKCRKCGSRETVIYFGDKGAPFLRCQSCGEKRRTGLSAELVSQLIRQELATMGGVKPSSSPASVPAVAVPQISDKDVQSMVQAALVSKLAEFREAAKPQVIEIKQDKQPAQIIEGEHYQMVRLLRLLAAGLHVYMWGDAGTGKTTAALNAARILKLKAEIDTLDPTTFRSMVQGFISADGKTHVSTAFTRCWEQGMAYVADETDNAPGHVQTLFNSALANQHAPLAWGNVAKHKKFLFIGTGNTPGRPTRAFPDRKPMSAAFADRLYFVHWMLDPAIEARAAGMAYMTQTLLTAEPIEPARWVKFVQSIREWARVNCPTLMVTPRASLAGLVALKAGEAWQDVADALIFRGADDEIRNKALNAVRI